MSMYVIGGLKTQTPDVTPVDMKKVLFVCQTSCDAILLDL